MSFKEHLYIEECPPHLVSWERTHPSEQVAHSHSVYILIISDLKGLMAQQLSKETPHNCEISNFLLVII